MCYDGPIILPLGVSSPHSCSPVFMWGTQLTFPWGLPLSHLPTPPPTRSIGGGWPLCDLSWERWLPVCVGSSLPWGGEGRAENPFNSCLKAPLTYPCWELDCKPYYSPIWGVSPPSLPSSSDCLLSSGDNSHCQCVFGTCWKMGMLAFSLGLWDPERAASLGNVIEEGSNVFFNGTILGV